MIPRASTESPSPRAPWRKVMPAKQQYDASVEAHRHMRARVHRDRGGQRQIDDHLPRLRLAANDARHLGDEHRRHQIGDRDGLLIDRVVRRNMYPGRGQPHHDPQQDQPIAPAHRRKIGPDDHPRQCPVIERRAEHSACPHREGPHRHRSQVHERICQSTEQHGGQPVIHKRAPVLGVMPLDADNPRRHIGAPVENGQEVIVVDVRAKELTLVFNRRVQQQVQEQRGPKHHQQAGQPAVNHRRKHPCPVRPAACAPACAPAASGCPR